MAYPTTLSAVGAVAHLSADGREHDLDEHLREVGALAARFAAKWGARDLGHAAGVLHDLGKYAGDFQDYIRAANRSITERTNAHVEDQGASDTRKRVNHSAAGALHAQTLDPIAGGILAHVIAGHHAGLADRAKLHDTLARFAQRLDDARRGGAPEALFAPRPLSLPFASRPDASTDPARLVRRFELLTRMIFSALCDADFLDTESFFDVTLTREREAARRVSIAELGARLNAFVDAKEAAAPATLVNAVRREVRGAARSAAISPPGVFTLTVPTGGGKTLAAMEFALAHAVQHGLERVIVAIPYTSIIEQNAAVYADAFGEPDLVLEHHSSFDPRRETARSRLSAQNWDVPIIVTTTVQLFESLFARRTSRCRKLHNIARSVIVLDEAQTLPPALLEPTLEVLGELIALYGSSLVISTATQPAFGRESVGSFGLSDMREIVPAETRAFQRLRRVDVRWPEDGEPLAYDALADELAGLDDVLAITHRRDDARKLTELVDARIGDVSTIHLSALMCAEHRSEVLAAIRTQKSSGSAVRVVSTQLVEAGVDLDFPIVYRAMAGLDSLAQAAGRCNREGKLERGELRVFVAETAPPTGVPEQGLAIARSMLAADPALDLFAPEAHRIYFRRLYATSTTDAKDVQTARSALRFEEVATLYRLIESDWSLPIAIRFGRGAELLDELERWGPTRARLRALGRFTVNAPRRFVEQWINTGHAVLHEESGVVALAEHVDAYDPRFGLVPERVVSGANAPFLIVDE